MKENNSFDKEINRGEEVHRDIPGAGSTDLKELLEPSDAVKQRSGEESGSDPGMEPPESSDGEAGRPLDDTEKDAAKSFFFRINWHAVFGISILIFLGLVVFKIMTWGKHVDLDSLFDGSEGTYQDDYDSILPLLDGTPQDDGVTTVVAFGNAPFADDRESPDNLARLIEDMSGAKVYNCSVADTFLAAAGETFRSDLDPMDAFNFYWLTTLIALDNTAPCEQAFAYMGDNTPADAREVYETLTTLDFNTVDVITLMYDGSDYLDGRQMYNDENTTDIQQFTGNMEAGIELIQKYFPNIRIIVMSPTYAFGVDDNGEYVSSDIKTYGQDVLSTYVIKQFQSAYSRSVTFVDNLYGTIHEDIAAEYLTDNLHLNLKGRKKVAERFVEALTYYDAPAQESSSAQ